MTDYSLDDLRAELDEFAAPKKTSDFTSRQERIIAGFEEIERFVDEYKRMPQHDEDRDIFERIYALRLDKIRASEECLLLLKQFDKKGLLEKSPSIEPPVDEMDDDTLLSELGIAPEIENDISRITHVTSKSERNPAYEIAQRTICKEFDTFKPLFSKIQNDLNNGDMTTKKFEADTEILVDNHFILFGQKAYVASMGPVFENAEGRKDARLRVVFDNGTESNMLMRSLQRALYKDPSSRRILPAKTEIGPLFSNQKNDISDIESGYIYVARSLSDHPEIRKNRAILHKIGVTGDKIEKRISDAKNDPTFLMADVEIVATYKLANINRIKLENLIHKFFSLARLDIEIIDRFGQKVSPREWYLVPLFIVDEAVELIKNGKITEFSYDVNMGKIVSIKT